MYISSISILHLIALGSLCASMAPLTESSRCPPHHFVHVDTGVCSSCQVCPINHIVRRPCTDHSNTVCSRFYEFQNFEQGPAHDDGTWDVSPSMGTDEEGSLASNDLLLGKGDEKVDTTQTKGPTVQEDGERWRILCFALIGALASVSLCSLICILFLQFRAKRAAHKRSQAEIDPEGAVYVHLTPHQPDSEVDGHTKFVHLETQLAKNKQHTRLLQRLFHPRAKFLGGNEYVDHVVNPDARGPFLLDTIPESDPPSSTDSTAPLATHGATTSSGSQRSSPSPTLMAVARV